MNVLKRVLGHLYFGYAILLFAATMLVVVFPIWLVSRLPEPRASRLLHPIFKTWMAVYLTMVFIIVRRKGKSFFTKGESFVVVCNHNSFADVPVTSPYIPGPNKTLAKASLAKIPIFGIIYRAGSILVDRGSRSSRGDAFPKMQAVLEQGIHLCLYPEGTRNKSSEPLQPFYDGAFITAIKSQRPIIPGLLFNTRAIFPGEPSYWALPRSIRIHFLEPIPTTGLNLSDLPALKEKVHQIMESYYVAHR